MWSKRFIEYIENDTVFLSIVFTWDLPNAYQRAVWLRMEGYHVIAGGPAVRLMPDYLADVVEIGQTWDKALAQHNPDATFTSRGCIRHCSFCAVWRTEGDLIELKNWEVKPIVCDNNLLACSQRHFDGVVDKLKPLQGIDFNQGLDARLLTNHHANRLTELKCFVRLAFDHVGTEKLFLNAVSKLKKAGFPKSRIGVYVLLGYKDTPEDALYRLQLVRDLGLRPNPMRYHPLDAIMPNHFIGEQWTNKLLIKYMRYWANLRYTSKIPFSEFC